MTAMLVRGTDGHGNFTLAAPPKGVLTATDTARCEGIAGQRDGAMFATMIATMIGGQNRVESWRATA